MPSSVLGTPLAVILLCLVAASMWLVWRRPFVGLGVLVAGMAFHNFAVMVLLALHTPAALIRVVQSWKELVIALLIVLAARELLRSRDQWHLRRLIPMDWIALAFAAVLGFYLVLPSRFLPGDADLLQRLVAFRVAALIPVLYFLGRIFSRPSEADLKATAWLIVGAAAVVGAFGLYELWFVPTARWLDWGVNLFSAWLGFSYNGPGGLPPNFFQSLPDGLLLRRMVSTYISPLGIAYTGLVVWPIAVVLVNQPKRSRRMAAVAIGAVALLLAGILFSVTRLALAMLVAEAVLLALILGSRTAWGLAALVAASVTAILFVYPLVGPVVDPHLIHGVPSQATIIYIGDPSLLEHYSTLGADVQLIRQHPFGTGLGGSVHRFLPSSTDTSGTGESAILGVFGDIGVLGGALYVALYGLSVFFGLRALRATAPGSLASALLLVAGAGGLALFLITLTSDVWADFSVTFLYWWAAGYAATMVRRRVGVAVHTPATPTAV